MTVDPAGAEPAGAAGLWRDHFRDVVDDGPQAIVVHVEGRLRYLNVAAARLLRLRPGEGVGRLITDFVQPVSLSTASERLRLIRAGHGVEPAEIQIRCADGDQRHIETVGRPVLGNGEPAALLACWDVTDRVREQRHLAHLANHDVLTGLPNRALLIDRVEQGLARLTRGPRDRPYLAVLFLDLDCFKTVNDHYSHAAGDALLQEVARRLRVSVRPGDTVSRLGGDEFVVLCEDLREVHEAEAVADRLEQALAAPYDNVLLGLVLRASVGIVVTRDAGARAEELLDRADAQMYRVKTRHRGLVR